LFFFAFLERPFSKWTCCQLNGHIDYVVFYGVMEINTYKRLQTEYGFLNFSTYASLIASSVSKDCSSILNNLFNCFKSIGYFVTDLRAGLSFMATCPEQMYLNHLTINKTGEKFTLNGLDSVRIWLEFY
jgi:hypothetical protein